MTDNDRAEQISARLAAASDTEKFYKFAKESLAWLLDQRRELLARVEAAEREVAVVERTSQRNADAHMDAERRVKAAERAGAVKALEARAADTRVRGDIGKPGGVEAWDYLATWANLTRNGAPL